MTARKPATKTAVAAARNGSKPVASFSAPKGTPRIASTSTGRVSSATPHFEEVIRHGFNADSRDSVKSVGIQATEPAAPRDTIQDATLRVHEAISTLNATFSQLESVTCILRPDCRIGAVTASEPFDTEASLLSRIHYLESQVYAVNSRLFNLIQDLDL